MFSNGQKVMWTPAGSPISFEAAVLESGAYGITIRLTNGDLKLAPAAQLRAAAPAFKDVSQLNSYTRGVVEAIKTALNYGNKEEVMALLRAGFRGPDQGQQSGNSLKLQTTGALRRLILDGYGPNFGDCAASKAQAAEMLANVSKSAVSRQHGEHFASQVARAAAVFGITLRP